MRYRARLARVLSALLPALLLVSACAPAAAPAPAPAAAPAKPAAAPTAAAKPAASGKPELATSPRVSLKVGVLPITAWAGHYIAQEKGYFNDVGLDVEFVVTGNVNEALPSLTQGQIQVGACASSAGCFNALNRQTDLKIVADLQSSGKSEKSTGTTALVVRKDLWDNGTIREPKDLVGYPIYNIAGLGSGHHVQVGRWLQKNGLDPRSFEWPLMLFPDILAAMLNKGIEVGAQVEPLISAGTARGATQIMATQEEMLPGAQVLYVMYWSGIDRLGPQVGERFMVAYLRGVRDYVNAFEYGVDQDAIIKILAENTTIKDPAIWKQIKYSWDDPNGVLSRSALESDIQFFRDMGVLTTPIDLSPMFDDRYREFAVRYLGEYQPPR